MTRKKWTQEEMDLLSRLYPDHFAKEIAALLGRKVSSVFCKAQQLGLKSDPEKIRRAGRMSSSHPNSVASRFKKGHASPNKGKAMPPETYAALAPTMYKKGHVPHNHLEVGTERVNADGYLVVKVAEPNKWREKHRILWEQHNGPIPAGFNVQFKNHDPLDCRIDNLYLISREDQLRHENSYIAKYPKDLQDVIRMKGFVVRQIRKHERKKKNGIQEHQP